MKLLLSEAADIWGTESPAGDCAALGYSIDSRSIRPGEMFFALPGARRDGHEFVEQVLAAGAAAAVVEKRWARAHPESVRLLAVDDVAAALAKLAREARLRWAKPIVAVTGSNGKTTTKNLTAAFLAVRYRTSKTEGNLNNELGLPLSILRMADDAEIAVVEMGMNHAGEIRRLAETARPSVGVVTNVNAVHLENFSSLDEIAAAKRELIESLGPEGTAVLNADDARVIEFARAHSGPKLTFGLSPAADIQAGRFERLESGETRFLLAVKAEGKIRSEQQVTTRLRGRHNAVNISAAMASASLFGLDVADVAPALAAFEPPPMRGRCVEIEGVQMIDDCYNSNPCAVAAMLEVLGETKARRKVAVLGEMLELGESSKELHRRAGRGIAEAGVSNLVAVGGDAREFIEGAVRCGMPAANAFFFEQADEAGKFLAEFVKPGDAVLFKASRGVELERALERVCEKLELTEAARTG